MPERTILWRRLDSPGHDACTLQTLDTGWRLTGMAVFLEEGRPCQLRYTVDCDAAWRTRRATVVGWMGTTALDVEIVSEPVGCWRFNGAEQHQVAGLVDVDLGFTPATNLIQLRRLDLEVGQGADAPVAYLRFPELRFEPMEQRYHRLTADEYDYRSPRFGYAATLRVSDPGFVTHYPDLWELEARE
jgi:hypothetical protein